MEFGKKCCLARSAIGRSFRPVGAERSLAEERGGGTLSELTELRRGRPLARAMEDRGQRHSGAAPFGHRDGGPSRKVVKSLCLRLGTGMRERRALKRR
jgi:hypothetical protein